MNIFALSGIFGALIAIIGITIASATNIKKSKPLATLSDSSLIDPFVKKITILTMTVSGLCIATTVSQINAIYLPGQIQTFSLFAILASLFSIGTILTLNRKIYNIHYLNSLLYVISTYIYQLLLWIKIKDLFPTYGNILLTCLILNVITMATIFPLSRGKIYFEFAFGLTAGAYMSTLSIMLI